MVRRPVPRAKAKSRAKGMVTDAKPWAAVDWKAAPCDAVQAAIGCSRTTLERWQADGAPCRKVNGRLVWDVPALVEWRRRLDVERMGRQSAARKADLESPIDDLDDEALARRALREEMIEGKGIAKIQAAKAVLEGGGGGGAGAQAEPLFFVEIENHDGAIRAAQAIVECPHCGKQVVAAVET